MIRVSPLVCGSLNNLCILLWSWNLICGSWKLQELDLKERDANLHSIPIYTTQTGFS